MKTSTNWVRPLFAGLSVDDAQTSRVAMARLDKAADCKNDRRVKLDIVLTLSLLSHICHSDDERSDEEESAFPDNENGFLAR